MKGIHDVGGRQGFGPVVFEENEPPFHAPWEGRMHGIAVTCQVSGVNSTPEQRATIENMPPALYLETSYYEKWLYAYEKLLNDKGIVTTAEIDARVASQSQAPAISHPAMPDTPSDYAAKVRHIIYNGTPHDRALDRAARFKEGDRVTAISLQTNRHTRLPSFVMGKTGTVEIYQGAHCSHEALAARLGEDPEHLYAVKFSGVELWGDRDGSPLDAIYVDLFENYLEAAKQN